MTIAMFMKTSDISQTALIRKYGVRGGKLFGRLWFSLLYVFLIALAAALPVIGPEVAAGWRRIVVGCISGALIVLAASLLTRMRLEFQASIEQLETGERAV
jgi:hypothetical protein